MVKNPMCPNCEKSEFAYRRVTSIGTINSIKALIAKTKTDKKSVKEKISKEKKDLNRADVLQSLENSIANYTRNIKIQETRLADTKLGKTSEHVILVYCLGCGHIIGTGAKSTDPR